MHSVLINHTITEKCPVSGVDVKRQKLSRFELYIDEVKESKDGADGGVVFRSPKNNNRFFLPFHRFTFC